MSLLLPAVRMPGFRGAAVYFVQATNGLVKIGRSTNMAGRLPALQCGSPLKLALVAWAPAGLRAEADLHRAFADVRKHGEWFDLSPRMIDLVQRLNARRSEPYRVLRVFLQEQSPPSRQSIHSRHLTEGV